MSRSFGFTHPSTIGHQGPFPWRQGLKQLGWEADHSPAFMPRLRMSGFVSPLPIHAFMTCTRTTLSLHKLLTVNYLHLHFHSRKPMFSLRCQSNIQNTVAGWGILQLHDPSAQFVENPSPRNQNKKPIFLLVLLQNVTSFIALNVGRISGKLVWHVQLLMRGKVMGKTCYSKDWRKIKSGKASC